MNEVVGNNSIQAMPAGPGTRSKSGIWLRYLIIGVGVVILGLLVTGFIYQAIGMRADQVNFPPPGQLYDIGGYRLHLYCTGPEIPGNPTIILETMAAGTSVNWGWIQPELAKSARVCSYDRSGRGWSEPGSNPLTLKQTAADLHALLQKAEVNLPYLLVGHSIGGAYVREFANLYPGEVSGMVLVDSALPQWFDRFPETAKQANFLERLAVVYPTLARIGLFRYYFATGHEIDFAGLPPKEHAELAAFWSSPIYFNSMLRENQAAPSLWTEALSLGSLGNIPLAVITRGTASQSTGWAETQEELAKISSNSLHVTIDGSTHESLAFNQKDASETSQVILKVLEAVRTGNRLASK